MNHSIALRDRKFVKLERHAPRPSVFIFLTSTTGLILLLVGLAAYLMETIGFVLSGTWTTLTLQQMFIIYFHNESAPVRHVVHLLINQPIDVAGTVTGTALIFLTVLTNWLFAD